MLSAVVSPGCGREVGRSQALLPAGGVQSGVQTERNVSVTVGIARGIARGLVADPSSLTLTAKPAPPAKRKAKPSPARARKPAAAKRTAAKPAGTAPKPTATRKPGAASGRTATRKPARRRATAAPGQRERDVLRLVRERPGITVAELGGELSVDSTGLYAVVRRLQGKGQISKDGTRLQPVSEATPSADRSATPPAQSSSGTPAPSTEPGPGSPQTPATES
jgi:hypothetical protein